MMQAFIRKKKKGSRETKCNKLKPSNLPAHWATLPRNVRVLSFYSQHYEKTGFLSNFYASTFKYRMPTNVLLYPGKTLTVKHAEQAIMLSKAALFNDKNAFDRIRRCSSPVSCKRIGRMVRDFNEEVWSENVIDIAERVLWYKFSAGEMHKMLIRTGSLVLAEASPTDKIWGIGVSASDHLSSNIATWQGFNLLGYSLMKVRERLLNKKDKPGSEN